MLVALAIAALGVGALLQAAAGGLTNVDVAAQYVTATHRAQALLATIGIERPLAAGEHDGSDDDGLRWHVKITPALAGSSAEGAAPAAPSLFAVEVAVSWRRGIITRKVVLDSLRVGITSSSDD